jgi:hypothetical protein
VGVEEGREGVQPGGVELLAALAGFEVPGAADLGEAATPDEQISRAVEPSAGVDEVRAPDDQVGRLPGPAVELDRRARAVRPAGSASSRSSAVATASPPASSPAASATRSVSPRASSPLASSS